MTPGALPDGKNVQTKLLRANAERFIQAESPAFCRKNYLPAGATAFTQVSAFSVRGNPM